MNGNIIDWVAAARIVHKLISPFDAKLLYNSLTPTTGAEEECIRGWIASPDNIDVGHRSIAWANVSEAYYDFIEFTETEELKKYVPQIHYFSCGIVGLFLVGGIRVVNEDLAATAMISALWSVSTKLDYGRNSLRIAFQRWPNAFCHSDRNLLASLCANYMAKNESNTKDALLNLTEVLDRFDRPLDRARIFVNDLR